ncbi:MAG TPA: tetratricopeptide repeat protein [Acidobacteriaceae bacterium]|jgi:tetratricopeptide (TPR) repeat protein/TolB-like protein|nr:tetratricopeptide repeat protein [Acidobacteriaceae bacterium]
MPTRDFSDPVKTPPSRPRPEPLGRTVGRFRIEALLGSGGMGEVYRAFDTALERPVAIKRMFWREDDAADDRSFFLREGRRASALSHANIAAIYDVIEEKDDVLLIMEFVAGSTLRERIGTPMPLDRFFPIALQCVDALAAAHTKGILHGDVKPENIMLTPAGQVKLLDFGVARRIPGSDPSLAMATTLTLSERNVTGGTPVYMSPEVLRGEMPDARADIFALGLVFYEMLCGSHPFRGANVTVTTAQILNEREAAELDRSPAKIPRRLASVVGRSLMKDPARRYTDAHELRRDLETVRDGGRPARARPFSLPRWAWFAVVPLIVLALLALFPASRSGIAAWWQHLRGSASAPAAPPAPRLAVLPARIDGTSPALTAFADGLTATVAARLSTLSQNHDLQVIDSTRVERARAAAPAQAMNTLGANLALQIEVQQSPQMNRVVWTLTSTRSGQTLATHTLTAPVSDPFSLQDQVADGVVQALQITLRPDEQAALAVHGTTDPAAYDYYLQGNGYLARPLQPGNIGNAVEVLNRAIGLDPNFGKAYAERGRAYWLDYTSSKQTSWVDKARDDCSKAVSLGNAGADGHVCTGLIDAGTGHYQEAADEYQKAIELDPTAEHAYVGLADAYTKMNRLADAEATWRQAIAANPNSVVVYERLGAFSLQQAEYAKAADNFRKAIELAPESYPDYSNLGAAYLYLGNYPAASTAFQRSLQLHPAPGAYSNLGTAYYQSRRFVDAAHNYESALHYNEHDPDLWGNLAAAYHFSNQQARAIDAYKKQLPLLQDQLKVNPRDAALQGEIAACYGALGDKTQATDHLALSLSLGRDNKDLLFNAAVVYNDLGETGDALEWLHKSLLAGYSASIVRDSPEFDNLRGNPQFQQLLSQASVK